MASAASMKPVTRMTLKADLIIWFPPLVALRWASKREV
jgi:hypothetical protein